MHRLFVAIRPPLHVRALLRSVMHGAAGARWQDGDQLHLTLRFIGVVDTSRAGDVTASLHRVKGIPFTLAMSGAGVFATKQKIHTLWAGIQPSGQLEMLQRRVDHQIDDEAPAEGRSYVPHITLARFSRSSAPMIGMELPDLPSATFEVADFWLCESFLTDAGAAYSMIKRYTLG